jgi:hypothetical protein
MAHPQPITATEKAQAVRDFISGLHIPASALTLRARDLTWTQARDTVLAMANQQYFTLDDSISASSATPRTARTTPITGDGPSTSPGSAAPSDGDRTPSRS